MKTGRQLLREWAEKDSGYFEYSPAVKLKILDFIIRSNGVMVTRANQVATNTYEVFNALIWYEDFLVKYIFKDLEANAEGWFYMTYENFEEKFGIKKDVVRNAVKILKIMGWIDSQVKFGHFNGEPRRLVYYRIIQSKIAQDAGLIE